jgi:hypothetical protein
MLRVLKFLKLLRTVQTLTTKKFLEVFDFYQLSEWYLEQQKMSLNLINNFVDQPTTLRKHSIMSHD